MIRYAWAAPWVGMVVGLHLLHSAWLSFAIYHGLVLLVLSRKRDALRALGRGWRTGPALLLALGGVLGGVLLLVLAGPMGVTAGTLAPALARLGLVGPAWPAFICYHALVNPWLEEAFWRGALGDDSPRPVPADFLFAGYHLLVLVLFVPPVWLVPALVSLVTAAWAWRRARRICGGLLVPAVSHLAADAAIMGAAWWLARSPASGS